MLESGLLFSLPPLLFGLGSGVLFSLLPLLLGLGLGVLFSLPPLLHPRFRDFWSSRGDNLGLGLGLGLRTLGGLTT